jgi:hypothetical protein
MNQTIDLLTSHRSIRKFTDEPVDPALFTRLVEAAQASASSSFLQGVTIIRVTDPGKRAAWRHPGRRTDRTVRHRHRGCRALCAESRHRG